MPNGPVISGYIYNETLLEECFPLNKSILDKASKYLYIEGKIHNKYALFSLRDKNGEYMTDTEMKIFDGQLSYVIENKRELMYICFKIFIDKKVFRRRDLVIFSFKIIDYGNLIDTISYTDPMIVGEFYRRLLPKGHITYFYGAKSSPSAKKYDYTLNNIKGLSKLYIGECKNFPDCHYNKEDLPNLNQNIPVKMNNYMIWNTDKDNSSAIGIEKYVMVIDCEDNSLNGDYCEFETSIIQNGKDIILIENQKLSKFVLAGEKGNLIVDLKSNRFVKRLTIDIIIYNGDIIFAVKETNLYIKQYYLSNKILFNVNPINNILEKVTIEFVASKNSFFTIKYSIDNQSIEQTEERINSGESYLVQINSDYSHLSKTIYLNNIFNNNLAYLANFYQLNCKFEIENKNESQKIIKFINNYAQDYNDRKKIIDSSYYQYNIKIDKMELSRYNNEMCMLYVEGYEITNDYIREIVIPENIYQEIIFVYDFNKIRFTYPIIDANKDLSINVKVIDKAYYIINAFLNGQKIKDIQNLKIAVSSTYYISSKQIKEFCKIDKLCSLNLDIGIIEKIVVINPKIKIKIRETDSIPTYFQKNVYNLDYVCGNKFYYLYTDVGRQDEGEITLNFWREIGSVWAKIVKKDLQTPESEANWRKFFRFPGPKWDDSLPFDSYTKKLKIKKRKYK